MSRAQSRASNGPLPLLCALGRHKTDLLVRWNDGYYFTRCRRCGLDLVRTAFSGWTVPRHYRVVWQAQAPVVGGDGQRGPDEADAPLAVEEPTVPDGESDGPLFAGEEIGQVEFPIRDAFEALPLGLSMTDEAFAERPAEDDPNVEPAFRDRPMPLQGRKDGVGGLPIDDVLESLRTEPDGQEAAPWADDPAAVHGAAQDDDDGPVPPSPDLTKPAARARYPVIPDFMEEEFPGITWDPSTGKMIPGAQRDAEPAPPKKPGWRDAIREKAQAVTATSLEFIKARPSNDDAPPVFVANRPPPSAVPKRSFLERQGGVVAATIFGGFVLAAAIVDARSSGPARIAYRPELLSMDAQGLPGSAARASDRRTASAAARPSTRGEQAFVTASLLNCRAVPTNDGETVRRLSRGDAVKVLGADPGWVSVSHQGRQCWASSQWISTVKPL